MDWFNPFEGSEGGGGGSGTDNYNELINKPSINNVVLSGNKTEDDLGLQKKISSNNKISSDNVSDLGAQNLFTNATEKQAWNAKQDAIQNLQDIQNGAAAGATAVQTISINGVQQTKNSGNIDLPAYPTTLPASDTTNLYDPTGTSPISGKGVAAAIGTLDVAAVGGSGSFISGISETNGKISATPTTMDTSLSNSSTNNSCPTSKTVYDDQQRQETEIGAVANAGAKNNFNISSPDAIDYKTTHSISDDSVTITGSAGFSRYVVPVSLKAGSYIFTANVNSISTSGRVRFNTASDGTGTNVTSQIDFSQSGSISREFTIAQDTAFFVMIYSSTSSTDTASTLVISQCMIRPASITDDTFVPYAKTNRELTVENDSQQSEIDYAINTGVKNLFPVTASGTQTIGGVDFTVHADGTITANGTKTNNDWLILSENNSFDAGTYTLSDGLPVDITDCQLIITTARSMTAAIMATAANARPQTKTFNTAQTGLYYAIRIASGKTVNNLTFKPMIRPAEITSPVYQPYADTNPVLTQEVNWNVNNGVKNLFDINTSLPLKIYHTTYTLSDGSLTVTSNGSWGHHSVPVNLPAGNYIFTATISNFSKDSSASESSVRIRVTDTTATGGIEIASKAVTGNGAFELPFTWTGGQCYIQYYPNYTSTTTYVSSFTASNNMIRPSSITDSTFQPYTLPNPTLTPAAVKSVDEGAKNLIQNNCNSKTVHGVTATTNADGSITVSGSSDYTNDFLIMYDLYAGDSATSSYNSHLTLKAGTYVNKGTGRSDVKLQIVEYNTSSDYSIVSAGDTDTTFTLTKSYFVARLWCSKTANFSTPVTVYPMICTAADYAVSQKFVPYALPNPVITPALIEQVDNVAKNICNWSASTSTISGVTFTMNPDKTVSTSGTATARSQIGLAFTIPSTLKAGRYVLSGCPSGGAQSGTIYYCLYIWDQTAVARVSSNDTGNGSEFDWTPDPSHTYTITVDVRSGSNATGLIFKPMICTAADWAVSQKFVPYAPTNRELYESKADVSQVFGRGIALKTTDDCDNITDVGMYYALSSATVPATNAPFSTSGFRLRVESWYQSMSGVVSIIQIADKYSSSEYVEKRRIYFYTSNIGWRWTDWTTTINVSMTVPADRSLQSESLTKGATEMSGAEQDEPKSREEER